MDILPANAPQNKDRSQYWRQWRNQIVTKICAECHLPYQARRGSNLNIPTYCDSCKSLRRKRFRPQTFLSCQNCGVSFLAAHLSQKYCSYECKKTAQAGKSNAKRGKQYPHTQRASALFCPACGTQFRTTKNTKRYQQFYCSHDCYLKSCRVSQFENRVMDLIQSFGIRLERQTRRGRWLFDGSIPDTPILIEADGDYWHSHAIVRERDKRKNQWCQEQGYVLMRVPELEFNNNPVEAVLPIIARWERLTGQTATLVERIDMDSLDPQKDLVK